MKRRAFIPAAVCAIFLGSLGPALAAPSEDEIRGVEKEWAAAVAANDFAKIGRMLEDGLVYAHSTGIVETKDEYLGKLKTGTQKYDAIEHEKMTIRVYGDSAVAHSHVRMVGSSQGRPFDNRLMMMHFWVKRDGRWQLAAHQTTNLP